MLAYLDGTLQVPTFEAALKNQSLIRMCMVRGGQLEVRFEMMIELVGVVLKWRLRGLLEKLDLLLAERVLIVIQRFVALNLLNRLLDCGLINHILFSYILINTPEIKGGNFGAIINDPRVPIKVLLPGLLALILINEHELLSLTLIGVYGV
jgi:hypothetical protein